MGTFVLLERDVEQLLWARLAARDETGEANPVVFQVLAKPHNSVLPSDGAALWDLASRRGKACLTPPDRASAELGRRARQPLLSAVAEGSTFGFRARVPDACRRPRRACLRHTLRRLRLTSFRRAASETFASASALSATIRAFSASLQLRRRRPPGITSTVSDQSVEQARAR